MEDITEKAATLDVPVRTTLSCGQHHQEILKYTEVTDIDLVTMGTRGLTGIGRLLQGSVAAQVIEEADYPILTVNRRTAELKKHPYTFLRKTNLNRKLGLYLNIIFNILISVFKPEISIAY